ncbi:MAG TPA: BlaI/MecI/CopY family transcriptional regulator [Chloroflexota bacterium]|jgi:predicted transcriptional regulator
MVRRGRRDQRHLTVHGEQKYLGELQARIMEVAWERGDVTVRAVLDSLATNRELAYTTVMTVMARLADQGVLLRVRVGKTYTYRAACTREEFRVGIAGTLVNDLVDDFGELALSQFVDALERADPTRLDRLRSLLLERERLDDGA